MANKAAWLMAAKEKQYKVGDAAMPTPKANQVVVRNYAVAINPVDWALRDGILDDSLTFPFIAGNDGAGEVTAVGPGVTDFKVGDRVAAVFDPHGTGEVAMGGFQLYAVARTNGTAKLPDHVSYVEASVLPLAISTSASALFQSDTLALAHPQTGAKPQGKVVLIWGGSTSLGAVAIQMVVAAGYDVATTASSHNFEQVKALGAKYVFDHRKESVASDIVAALKGQEFGGVYCAIFDGEVVKLCGRIADQLGGRKFVSTVYASTMPLQQGLPDGVGTSNVWGTSLLNNEVGPAVWGKWVPAALADGSLKCLPPQLVYGKGLEAIGGACDRWKEGVSFQKVVVELP